MSESYGLTYSDVTERLTFDQESGKLYWRVNASRNVRAGSEAGCVKTTRMKSDGSPAKYIYVRVEGRSILAAQIVWLLIHGEWPVGRVGYKDGDALNIRPDNLEMADSLPKHRVTDDPNYRRDYLKAHRAAYPREWKGHHLMSKFGIGMADYLRMAVAQNNRCAICGEEETEGRGGKDKVLSVDHDHKTGKIRELLCSACNTGIGKLRDDPARLRAAADYIERHRTAEILPFPKEGS